MQRAAPLVPFSHDHQHTLAEALRLTRAEALDAADLQTAAQRFLHAYEREVSLHFREEETQLFPLLMCVSDTAPELLVRALVGHQQIRADVAALSEAVRRGDVEGRRLSSLGRRLQDHVRLEERELFPLIEELVPTAMLETLLPEPASDSESGADDGALGTDFTGGGDRGPLWGTATEDLNATALRWPPGHELAEHVNAERDVLVVVVEGSCVMEIDEVCNVLTAPAAVIVRKGCSRSLRAGPRGVSYVSSHLRRERLQISGTRRPT